MLSKAWKKIKAWFWAACGNSRTILIAYIAIIVQLLPDLKLVNWNSLLGVNRGEAFTAILTLLMIVMRLITSDKVSFKPKED